MPQCDLKDSFLSKQPSVADFELRNLPEGGGGRGKGYALISAEKADKTPFTRQSLVRNIHEIVPFFMHVVLKPWCASGVYCRT
jgi:hypothetical protein